MVFTFYSSILQVLVCLSHYFGWATVSCGLCFSGIIKAAPEITAHLRENMEEVVSLRFLEELCGPTNGNGTLSSLESKPKIDTSKSCKNVLQYLFHNVSSNECYSDYVPSKRELEATVLFFSMTSFHWFCSNDC